MPIDPSDLYRGYQAASTGSFRKSTIQSALNPYKITVNWLRGGGFSDMQLRRLASRAVLKRFYLQKSGLTMPSNYGSMSLADLKAYISSQG